MLLFMSTGNSFTKFPSYSPVKSYTISSQHASHLRLISNTHYIRIRYRTLTMISHWPLFDSFRSFIQMSKEMKGG